jgi:hypothetical protein
MWPVAEWPVFQLSAVRDPWGFACLTAGMASEHVRGCLQTAAFFLMPVLWDLAHQWAYAPKRPLNPTDPFGRNGFLVAQADHAADAEPAWSAGMPLRLRMPRTMRMTSAHSSGFCWLK